MANGSKSAVWADLRGVLAGRDFRRLFATRLVSQAGDGIVTAGVGTYVFFNATTFPSPAAGAAAFAVLYLPYSLIGPFAGVFIDRWSRRQILVWSALLRSVFVALTAAFMALGNRGVLLYVAVLLVLGVNRFFLSSLSAALPHVVAEDKLVMANSVSPTVGGISATIGGVVALGLNVATGNTERGAAITLLVGGGCYVAASLVAATMARDRLGPAGRTPEAPPRGPLLGELASVAAGLADGVRYVVRRRGPAAALGATGGFSFLFGPLFLMSILLYRNYFYRSSVSVAEGHFGAAGRPGRDRLRLRGAGDPAGHQAAVQARLDHADARRERGGDPRARRDLQPARLPGHRVLPVPDPAGRGDLRGHDLAGRGGRRLPGPGVRLLRHDVQRRVRSRGRAERGHHAGGRPLTAPVALVAAGFAVVAAAYWLAAGRDQSSSGGSGAEIPSAAAQSQQLLSDALPAELALG